MYSPALRLLLDLTYHHQSCAITLLALDLLPSLTSALRHSNHKDSLLLDLLINLSCCDSQSTQQLLHNQSLAFGIQLLLAAPSTQNKNRRLVIELVYTLIKHAPCQEESFHRPESRNIVDIICTHMQ